MGLLAYLKRTEALVPFHWERKLVKKKNLIKYGVDKIRGWKDKLFIGGSTVARSSMLVSAASEAVRVDQYFSQGVHLADMDTVTYQFPIISFGFYLVLTAITTVLMHSKKEEKPEENLEKLAQHPFRS
jgi:hypothetical protein